MILFHSDIDNTLIYSHRHDIGPDTVGVEIYQDRMISFMTSKSYMLLKQAAQRMVFVPTTTRTSEQYARLELGIPNPEYALVCNGGVLLTGGREDGKWYEDSLKLVEEAEEELRLAREYLTRDPNRCLEVRNIRELFLFTKSERPAETVRGIRDAMEISRETSIQAFMETSQETSIETSIETSKVDVFSNGAKIYVVPKSLNKGKACERLKEKLGAKFQIAAGDSGLDVPMLKIADLAIAPKWLCDACHVDAQEWQDGGKEVFSDFLLEYVLREFPFGV